MLCHGSCASSLEILPWCTCDWVTRPEPYPGARVPWLMFYKLPRGSRTNSVPMFPPCCICIVRGIIFPNSSSFLRQWTEMTVTSLTQEHQEHTNEDRGMHCSDALALSVCAGLRLVKGRTRKIACIVLPGGQGFICQMYVTRTPMVILELLFLSLSSWLVHLFAC